MRKRPKETKKGQLRKRMRKEKERLLADIDAQRVERGRQDY